MLAYFETVRNGLVPVRVTHIKRSASGVLDLTFVVTRTVANASAYPRGYCTGSTAMHVIPRHAVRRRKYGTTILPFSWADEAEKAGFPIEQEIGYV